MSVLPRALRRALVHCAATTLLLAPAAARALPGALDLCGGSSYTVCVRLSDWTFGTGVEAGGNGLGVEQLRVSLANYSAADYAPATITTFLISGLGASYDVVGLDASAGPGFTAVSSVTRPDADNGYTGVGYDGAPQPHFVGFDNQGNRGLAAGEATTLTFTFHRPIAQADFLDADGLRASLQFALHAQSAPEAVGALCGSTSSKAAWNAEGATLPGSANAGPAGCGLQGTPPGMATAVVPEPGTLALAATGLLGMAVVLRRRARG